MRFKPIVISGIGFVIGLLAVSRRFIVELEESIDFVPEKSVNFDINPFVTIC